jgi:uncharacterized RDD family membrane protein YckC
MTDAPPPQDTAAVGRPDYADWSQRALGFLIDTAILVGGMIVVYLVATILHLINYQLGELVKLAGYLAVIALTLRNQVIVQGSTGQSIGKKQIGIKLILEQSGRPPGVGLTFVRGIAHFLDGICVIGYLWPLWDEKKQTFADKIMTSIVVRT